MLETDKGLANVLRQMGQKFMIVKFPAGYKIRPHDDAVVAFAKTTVIGSNLDYDEAVALIRILEGDKYE